jgi:hypothetical protein
MAFPSSPTGGQQYTQDGRTWQWDGVAWEVLALAGPAGPAGAPGVVAATAPLAYNSGTQTVSIDLSAYSTTAAANGLYYPLSGNPSSFLTASALTPYLTSATAASTYQPLAGMSSYLTTANAATTYATILEPSVDGVLTVEPSGVNGATVNVNQDANNYIHLRSSAGQIVMVIGGNIKWFFNDTYLQFPGGTQQTVAYPGSSTFLLKAGNLSGLADTAVSRTNLGLGTMAVETASNYLTTATAASTYQPISGMSSYLTTANAASTYQTLSGMSSYLTSATAASTYFTIANAANKADLASPTFTGAPSLPTGTIAVTQTAGNNTTAVATTAFVTAAVGAGGAVTSVAGRTGAVVLSNTDISGLGTMATATAADYSTTTVANGLYYPLSGNPSGFLTSAPVTSVAGRTGAITLAVADVSGAAPLASPSLTGTPLSTTAAVDTNTTQIATTAFVVAQAASATPLVNGTAAVGTSLRYARADHVHGTDTTRAALASPTFTGTPAAPTATALTNTTQLATTAFVRADNNVKAWVNFNGTGTPAIRGSYNVSSLTDNGVGDYTVNFTTAMTDANYAVAGSAGATIAALIASPFSAATMLTTSVRVFISNTAAAGDNPVVCVSIIR